MKPRREFDLGRLAMALEVITVIKTLEDELVPMLTLQRQELISVLETLLKDQDLWEVGYQWYEALNLWRQPSFEREPSLGDTVSALTRLQQLDSAHALLGGGLQAAVALADSTRALLDLDQSPDPPSDGLEQEADEAELSMSNEESSVPDDSEESLAEFRQQSRSRRRTEP